MVRPSSEFFLKRRQQTVDTSRGILEVIPQMRDPEFGKERLGEIADYLSTPLTRVEYVVRLLRKSGYVFVDHGKVIAYFQLERHLGTE